MSKKFKAKKKPKHGLTFIFLVLLSYLVYQMGIFLFTSFKLTDSNEKFIMNMLEDSSYLSLYKKRDDNIFYKIYKLVTNVDVNNPVTLLEKSFNYKESGNSEVVYDEPDIKLEELEKVTSYMTDPNKLDISSPKVYIYNSHQLENYSTNYLTNYSITPNVLMASYLLKEKLNKLGFPTIVEEANITEFMKINNWNHADSYKASRFYVKDALEKYKSLELIIDLHRDALSKENSTVEIDGKKYAKILFVVGLEHDNHQKNLDLAHNLNDMLKKSYPTLTRGVITKKGENVDGIYNQDLSSKMILLEVGGNESDIDEVLNTLELVSIIVKDHLS